MNDVLRNSRDATPGRASALGMRTSLIVPLAVLAVPSVAHAAPDVATGTILHHALDQSVSSATIRDAPGLVAIYRAEGGLWRYDNGDATRIADDDANSYTPIWPTSDGAVYLQAGTLVASDGTASTDLVAPGDPCPDGSARTTGGVLEAYVTLDDTIYAQVNCGDDADIYQLGKSGTPKRLVYSGMKLPERPGGTEQPYLLGTNETGLIEWLPSNTGDVVFTAGTYGCSMDSSVPGLGHLPGGLDLRSLARRSTRAGD